MPQTQKNTSKVYFSIGEVAEELGVAVSRVRYWADEFTDTVKPHRNKKGDRFFTQRDLVELKKIQYLLKECGLTIRGAKARLDSERYAPRQRKPKDAQVATSTPDDGLVAQPDDLAVRAEVITRLSSVSSMLHEICKYL